MLLVNDITFVTGEKIKAASELKLNDSSVPNITSISANIEQENAKHEF